MADVTSLDTLLAVQERDTTLDQLEHRRATLPERARLTEIAARLADLDRKLVELGQRRDEVIKRQEGHEQELQASEKRIADIERRMYSGEVSATRDLLAMTGEVDSLRKRCSGLEDVALEAIEEREQLDAEVANLEERRRAVLAEGDEVHASLQQAEAQIDAEVAVERSQRDEHASGLPAELVAEYERLRQRLDGIGAARLVGPSCTGCHLTLPATEIDRIKRLDPTVVVYCDQCGRILVR